jgi:cholesterol 25-hydroxylase
VHLAFHRNTWLYSQVHAAHHHHQDSIHAAHTNNLSIIERLTVILSANHVLHFVGAHPLTRVVFVLPFVALLTDSHSGLDFPFWYDKIVPFHWLSGSRGHYRHHMYNDDCFAPFFSHMDFILNWIESRERPQKRCIGPGL